jgi:hypothetical protein
MATVETNKERSTLPVTVRWMLWIVGLLILGSLAIGLFVPSKFGSDFSISTRELTEIRLKNIADTIQIYDLERYALPQALEDLLQRNERVGVVYLKHLPLDSWKHPFAYRILNEAQKAFELRSDGEDGKAGTDDDIVAKYVNGSRVGE